MTKKIVLGVLCALILLFIIGNSLLPPETSGKVSQAAGELLAMILGEGNATQTVGGLPVRKVGHFVEFFALGVLVVLLINVLMNGVYLRCSIVAFVGLLIPVVDETVQIFSGRGSSLRDVWIDIGGYTVGVALTCAAFILVKRLKLRVKNNNKK